MNLALQPFCVEMIPQRSILRPVKFKLLSPLRFRDYDVHEGYVTDGATVPRLLWWLYNPMGPYAPAAAVHDYLLTHQVNKTIRRITADRFFREAMRELGLSEFVVQPMYLGVRAKSLLCAVTDRWLG